MLNAVIEPACQTFSIAPMRADRISKPGEITEQVFRAVRDSDIVIADVTDANPNVMYELGLRHTRNLLTIQLGETGKLPFDIAVIRTIIFKRSAEGFREAREALEGALRVGISGAFDPVTATRLWLEVWPRQRRPLLLQPPGALERAPEMMQALRALSGPWTHQNGEAMQALKNVAELRIPAKLNARSGDCERGFRASRTLIGAKRRRQWVS